MIFTVKIICGFPFWHMWSEAARPIARPFHVGRDRRDTFNVHSLVRIYVFIFIFIFMYFNRKKEENLNRILCCIIMLHHEVWVVVRFWVMMLMPSHSSIL